MENMVDIPIIQFSFADARVALREKRRLKAFIADLFQSEGRQLKRLQYVFCSDAYLLEINKAYLDHDEYTDIVTFEMADHPRERTEGEIYISVDRVRENAKELRVTFQEELLRVIFHGALHLCGHKDKSPEEQTGMRFLEDKYLRAFEVPRGT